MQPPPLLPVSSKSEQQPQKQKKPFLKNWIFWWSIVAVLIVGGQLADDKKDAVSSDTSSASSPSETRSTRPRILARQYARQVGETYGSVADVSSVPNGSYYGFPTGGDIETYQVTTYPRTGSSRTTSIIIALQPSGDDWEVVKKVVNY